MNIISLLCTYRLKHASA